ncbi:MAG: glycosyltransferase family 4 protein [Treponema sp.]|nr:glycosyltransferase family 4 protein [Treponema sp.]
MKIAIDCRHINSSGIGVYLKGCLPYFLASEHRFLLICRGTIPGEAQGHDRVEIIETNIRPFSLAEVLRRPKALSEAINACDLYYSPFMNIPRGLRIPLYTTIHDMVFPDLPGLVSSAGLALRMFFYRRAFRHSSRIFTVSEFSKGRIEYYSDNKVPVTVTHSALQPYLLEPPAGTEEPAPAFAQGPYILFVGNIKKNKGLVYLLDALLLAKKEGPIPPLVILGNMGNFRTFDEAVHAKVSLFEPGELHIVGSLSQEELRALFRGAALLVQPSLYEGFGLPPLEALVSGCPALISDIPVFREIYDGLPVQYFTLGNPEELKQKIFAIIEKNERINLTEEETRRYNFEKTARIIMKAWEAHA